jgi:hypothetical protein
MRITRLLAGVLLVAGLVGVAKPASAAPTYFVVTNTSGSVSTPNSLPWALQQANYNGNGFDVITFAIPGSGPHTINLSGTLWVNEHVHIAGLSQPGARVGEPAIYLRGNANIASIFLLHQNSSGSTIEGFAMVDFTSNAVTIFPSSQGNWIQYNWLGFIRAGGGYRRNIDTGLPNAAGSRGIAMASSFNVVRNNIVSGVYNGVVIGSDGGTWKTNSVSYNWIGLAPNGVVLGNSSDGIFLGAGARENFLGPGNIIGGNASAGVELLHPSNYGNVIFQNFIGVTPGGAAIPNNELGVLIGNGATWNAVGGPYGGNYIAANRFGGVALGTAGFGGARSNWVQYNVIGLTPDLSRSPGRQDVGVSINTGGTTNVVERNQLAANNVFGVIVDSSNSNTIRTNWIGMRWDGQLRPNGSAGVMLSKASANWVVGNAYDPTHPTVVQSGSSGNVIG